MFYFIPKTEEAIKQTENLQKWLEILQTKTSNNEYTFNKRSHFPRLVNTIKRGTIAGNELYRDLKNYMLKIYNLEFPNITNTHKPDYMKAICLYKLEVVKMNNFIYIHSIDLGNPGINNSKLFEICENIDEFELHKNYNISFFSDYYESLITNVENNNIQEEFIQPNIIEPEILLSNINTLLPLLDAIELSLDEKMKIIYHLSNN